MPTKITGNGGYTYDWTWTSFVHDGTDLWYAAITNTGKWRVFRNNADSSLNYCDLNVTDTEADDHNAPSLVFDNNGVLHVFYTRHNQSVYVNHGTISVNGSGQVTYSDLGNIEFPANVTYTRVVAYEDAMFLATRCQANRWRYKISTNNGSTWSASEVLFDVSAEGSLVYMQLKPFEAVADKYHLCITGNASYLDNFIYYGTLDMTTGDIKNLAGTTRGNIYTDSGLPLGSTDLTNIGIPTSNNRRTRLLDVTDKHGKAMIVYCNWGTNITSAYYVAVENSGSFTRSALGQSTGAEFTPTSEAKHYIGGSSYDKHGEDWLYLSQESSGTWTIKRFDVASDGSVSNPTTIASSSEKPLVRPVCVSGSNNLVYQELRIYNSYADYQIWYWLE